MFESLRHYLHVLRNHPRPVRFLIARVLVVLGLSERFIIDQQGYRLWFFPSNLSEQLWVNPIQREGDLAFFRAYLRPGDVVVDVGANVGDTCIVCARTIAPGGKVYAFEPHPQVFSWLEKNVILNNLNDVTLFNMALGQSDGTVAFSDDRRDDMNRVMGNSGGLSVPIRLLDSILADLTKIALLKIDVEGFEMFVLRGARRVLSNTDAVYVEVGCAHFAHFGYSCHDLFSLLKEAGFALLRFGSDGELMPINVSYLPLSVENVLAVRNIEAVGCRLSGTAFHLAA